MVIYNNNLHEKLQGVAISREYLKYNTPFCDMVDDPYFQLDLDIAINYYKGSTGNPYAAEKFVYDLVLNSGNGKLDWPTLKYYTGKIMSNPIFEPLVRNINSRFDNPELFSDDFQNDLNDLLDDCLNSPCNLFSETSDSIGRMAQAASTKSGANTFGVGDLKDTFTNMIGELDQAIFNKIPSLFQDGFVEATQLAGKAWTNTQAVLAGKKNILEMTELIQSGQSLRGTDKVYSYTPDIKSYFDFSSSGSNILSKIKENLGGCFDKFQSQYRYNPYVDNTAFPSGTHAAHVNGETIEMDAANKIHRSPDNSVSHGAQTGNRTPLPTYETTPARGKGFSDGKVAISQSYTLKSKQRGVTSHYSVFAGFVDYSNKRVWYENYSKLAGDKMTLKGISNMGENAYRLGASYWGSDAQLAKAIKGTLSDSEKRSIGTNNISGMIAAGWKHEITDIGMETLYNTPKTGIINDGVAISQTLFKRFINDPAVTPLSRNYKTSLQLNNEFFAALRVPNGKWYFYKVTDWNGQKESNCDLTVGAYQHFMKANNLGELKQGSTKPIGDTGWSHIKKIAHDDLGTVELKLCQGNIDDIKAQFGNPASLEEATYSPNVTFNPQGIRNKPLQPKLMNMINEASAQSGYRINIWSAGQVAQRNGGTSKGPGRNRTGSKRHDDGWAADIHIYDGNTRLTAANPAHFERLGKFVRILRSIGIESVGAGSNYQNGNLHIDIATTNGFSGRPAIAWGNGSTSANTPRWLREAY